MWQNRGNVVPLRSLSRRNGNDFEQRRQVALANQTQREQEDILRKFVLSHRREIKKDHVLFSHFYAASKRS